jgi:hypothetical protein
MKIVPKLIEICFRNPTNFIRKDRVCASREPMSISERRQAPTTTINAIKAFDVVSGPVIYAELATG